MKLLADLERAAFMSPHNVHAERLVGHWIFCVYRGWDDVDPRAYHYFCNGKQIEAEEAACLLDNDSREWRD